MTAMLMAQGWLLAQIDFSSDQAFVTALLSLAKSLGKPVSATLRGPLVSALKPRDSTSARKSSLSGLFSTGAFPLHVDTAHWVVPCRYVILACYEPGCGNRETLLFDTRELPLDDSNAALLQQTPFRVVNGRNSFYSTIFQRGRPFVRFDPGCMRSTTPDGDRAMSVFGSAVESKHAMSIRWQKGMALIIDNWRVLHGRGGAERDDSDRTLMRVYVNEVPK